VFVGTAAIFTTVRSAAVSASGRDRVAGLDAQKHHLSRFRQRRDIKNHFAPLPHINPSIFQGFVQAGPGSFKERRERPFGNAARVCFARYMLPG
jgi:hypothetical protein